MRWGSWFQIRLTNCMFFEVNGRIRINLLHLHFRSEDTYGY